MLPYILNQVMRGRASDARQWNAQSIDSVRQLYKTLAISCKCVIKKITLYFDNQAIN